MRMLASLEAEAANALTSLSSQAAGAAAAGARGPAVWQSTLGQLPAPVVLLLALALAAAVLLSCASHQRQREPPVVAVTPVPPVARQRIRHEERRAVVTTALADMDLATAIQMSMDEQHDVEDGFRVVQHPPMPRHAEPPDAEHQDDGKPQPDIEDIIKLKDTISESSLFELKRGWLRRQLEADHPRRQTELPLIIVVRRAHVVQDSFLQFSGLSVADLCKPLDVHYVGESARDDGGVTRDWYTSLSREIVDPQYVLFAHSAIDNYTFQINPLSDVNPEHLDFFHFIGIFLSKAVYDGCLLDSHFTSLFYKLLLRRKVTYDDMSTVDIEFHRSLSWLLENNITGMDLGLYFAVELESFGIHKEVELKPGGSSMAVTEENKCEYVDLLAQWKLKHSVESQADAIQRGFSRLVRPELLTHFDEVELEWLIAGLPKLDIVDWRKHTVYKAGYDESTPVIIWFWELVESWDQEMRARLLQFVTGTSKVPFPEGFRGLMGSEGPRRFHIVKVSRTDRLPQAHTCFNELILPPYSTKESLTSNLQRALFETGNHFGLR